MLWKLGALFWVCTLTSVVANCDQMERVSSGVGNSAKSVESEVSGAGSGSGSGSNGESEQGSGLSSQSVAEGESAVDDDSQDQDSIDVAQADTELTTVRLDAFQHFNCSDNWANRDGGLGLVAGSGAGVCRVSFPGATGRYQVVLMAQLEFDGGPKFQIAVDGVTIAAGHYPMSKGELICDCPNWRVNCPDRVVPIDAGVHEIRQGAAIAFRGEEVYPCGSSHGAYAKWRQMVFIPQ